MSEVVEMWVGDTEPDLEATITDEAGVADFSILPSNAGYSIVGVMGGEEIFNAPPDGDLTVADDEKSVVMSRQWQTADVDTEGWMEIFVIAHWPGGHDQTFRAGVVQFRHRGGQ